MKREERRRLICAKLAARIAEVAPAGLGHWNDAWDMVAAPSDAFLDALNSFLDEDAPETRDRIHAAASELVRAWIQAAQAWQAAGRPRGAPADGAGKHPAKEVAS